MIKSAILLALPLLAWAQSAQAVDAEYVRCVGRHEREPAVVAVCQRQDLARENFAHEVQKAYASIDLATAPGVERMSSADLESLPMRIRQAATPLGTALSADHDADADGVGMAYDIASRTIEEQAVRAEAATAEETTCRADAACMRLRADMAFAETVLGPLCAQVADAEELRASIAREKHNPAGVVNLRELHYTGRALQEELESIAALKGEYVTYKHAAFVPARDCR